MNEKYVQALVVGSLIGGAILLNGHLNKPKLPPMPGKAMVIAQNKEMSWNDADGNVHVMVKKMPVDEQAIVMEQKGNIKILKINDDGVEVDINIAFDGDLSDLSDLEVLEVLEDLESSDNIEIDLENIDEFVQTAVDSVTEALKEVSENVKVEVKVKKKEFKEEG
ncbi:MAG: hypothetical protein ISP93_02235 [SAR86 cluster bacterium]|jgi:hypothetical protein|nr:hypothetical protein [SAR86 cluster bacterium]MBL6811081.1 hypothetical protein [SAR86 cluster bacterium]